MIISDHGGSNIMPPREGVHIGVCTRVIDLGTQISTYKGEAKAQRKVLLVWELPDEDPIEVEGVEMPRVVQSRYTASLSSKATLTKLLISWRGKAFTPEELKGFDLKTIIGAPCQLQLIHDETGQYANVSGIMPIPKGMPKPTYKGLSVHLSLDPAEFDKRAFDSLSPKLQEMIAGTKEYQIATGRLKATPIEAAHDDFVPDDEIPF